MGENYQDEAMDQEYRKGKAAGRKQRKPRRKRSGKPSGGVCFPIHTQTSDNDPKWYIPNNTVAKDFASFPPVINTSRAIPLFKGATNTAWGNDWIPGVMAYDIMPVFPNEQQSRESVMYQSSIMLWEAIQAKNSRTPDFDPSDLLMEIIAVSNAYAAWMEAVRIYGVATQFCTTNAYWPQAILAAMNVDATSVQGNLANFRGLLNMVALQLGQIPLPRSIDYTNRMVFLNQNIYSDSKEAWTGSLYVPNMLGYYQWIEGDTADPVTRLEFVAKTTTSTHKRTFNEIIQYLQDMVSKLYNSEDVQMIGTTLLQAFGAGSMYQMNPIAETFMINPVYNEEVLSQLENAYVCYPCTYANNQEIEAKLVPNNTINAGWVDFSLLYITPQRYLQTGGENTSSMINVSNYLNYTLNHHSKDVTPEQIIVATRLMHKPIFTRGTTSSAGNVPLTVSNITQTELVLGCRIVSRENAGNTVPYTIRPIWTDNFVSVNRATGIAVTTSQYQFPVLCALSKFDWHFKVNYWDVDPDDTDLTATFVGSLFDYDRYTLLSDDNLSNLGYMAALGLFTPKQLPNILTVK